MVRRVQGLSGHCEAVKVESAAGTGVMVTVCGADWLPANVPSPAYCAHTSIGATGQIGERTAGPTTSSG